MQKEKKNLINKMTKERNIQWEKIFEKQKKEVGKKNNFLKFTSVT